MINCYFTDILLIFEIKFVNLQSKRNNIQILIDNDRFITKYFSSG